MRAQLEALRDEFRRAAEDPRAKWHPPFAQVNKRIADRLTQILEGK
jgi:hypothetical protein